MHEMKVIFERCAGLDVHKKTVVACRIIPGSNGEWQVEIRTFGTMTSELLSLADWLRAGGVSQVAMESTGVYWKPVYNIVEGEFEVLLVNAKHIKFVPGRKSDVKDAQWMVAFALRADGWYLRSDIIWAKPNGMPESVRDRCTKSHEYVFMFSKSQKYYYDSEAIKTEAKESSVVRAMQDTANQIGGIVPGKSNGNMKAVLKNLPDGQNNIRKLRDKQRGYWDQQNQQSFRANKRSVWTCSPAQYPEEHFAVFPEELIWDMVLAGCPEGGVVLYPFFGRGTTGVVARKQNKNYIGFELLLKNCKLAEKYLYQELGMFK